MLQMLQNVFIGEFLPKVDCLPNFKKTPISSKKIDVWGVFVTSFVHCILWSQSFAFACLKGRNRVKNTKYSRARAQM